MALPDAACFPGLDQADQYAAIYEALYDLAQDDSLLDPSCFKGQDRLSQLTDFYAALYAMAGDDTLTSPDCFPGLDLRDQLTAIYAASILINPTPPPPEYDPDAQAYFDRVSAVSEIADTEKDIINTFIVDLKAASLWAILTEGWIGRSAYNAGSGNTLFALRSAANNGTFVNAPSWSADGVVFTGNTQAVTLNLVQTMNHDWTAVSVFKDGIGDVAANRRVFGSTTGQTLLFISAANKANTSFGAYNGSVASTPFGAHDITVFKMVSNIYREDGASSALWNNINGAPSAGFNQEFVAAGGHTLQFNTSAPALEGMTAGVISIGLIFAADSLTDPQEAALYTIVKNTIGSGLSLP